MASNNDNTPGHNLDTYGYPRALKQAGALNISKETDIFLHANLSQLHAIYWFFTIFILCYIFIL